MSRKPAIKAPPAPSRARAESLLRSGQVLEAVKMAREVHQRTSSEENLDHRKSILAGAADALLDANKPFGPILEEADTLTPAAPEWIRIRAGWLARSGRLDDARARVAILNDPADAVRLLHLVADQSVRLKSNSILPPELHSGHAAILTAFQHYDAGDDEKARETLQSIGLQSPFLDWKVFLRGLIAFANQDHARAIENWDRLDQTRLAARLEAPLRFSIDPTYRDSLSDTAREVLRRRNERLHDTQLLDGLRQIRQSIGRENALAGAFREAGPVVPQLMRVAPDLVPRLASCFYHAIIHHGQPDDLARYRTLFGPPADDPKFERLHATVSEQVNELEVAHRFWNQYAQWLASHPPTWPADVAERARAIVWFRMALNAHVHGKDLFSAAFSLLHTGRSKPSKTLTPDTATCLKYAIEIAPDWGEPSLRLVQEHLAAEAFEEAEKVARDHLARKPDDLEMLTELGTFLNVNHEFAKAVPVWQKAHTLQPLDEEIRAQTSLARIAAVRQRSADAEPTELRAALAEFRSGVEELFRNEILTFDATLALKAGQKDEAEALIEQVLAAPDQRFGATYRLAVEATLANLKPAMKTKANKRFKDALTGDPSPREVAELLLSLKRFQIGGFKYRGEKAHEKQALALIPRTLDKDVPASDFGMLATILETLERWKELLTLAAACSQRFPTEAIFPYFEALAMHRRREREYRIEKKLHKAKNLLKDYAPEKKRILMEKIESLEKQLDTPFEFPDEIFEMFDE